MGRQRPNGDIIEADAQPDTDHDGLFILLKIGGRDVNCLVDTGSTLSVMHPSRYEAIPEQERPKLATTDNNIRMADGGLVKLQGKATFTLTINDRTFEQDMVIADIEVPAVIGYDFLHRYTCQIDIVQQLLVIDGMKVNCMLESSLPSVFRISITENITIPCSSEMIVPAKVEGNAAHITRGIIDQTNGPTLDGLLVATTLVDPSRGVIPIRVLNLSGEEQKLCANTQVASCYTVRSIDEVKPKNSSDIPEEMPEHLQGLCETSREGLADEEVNAMETLLVKHQDVFARSKEDLGRTTIAKHKINTGDAGPIRQPPRRVPIAKREEVKMEVQKMLDQKIIEPCKGPWSAPIVLVKKKDGTTRFCVDYRRLNSCTYKDSYPLPKIDESLDSLRGSRWFSTLDLASGYWQVAMDEQDVEKTGFATTCGLYQFTVMPFGLCNAPATFERMMEVVLSGLHWETCLLYIDDIIVFADSFEQHIGRLSEILSRIESAGLKLSPKKCKLFKREVEFLGHVVSQDGIATDPKKVEVVKNWPTPKNVHDVRSFLGLCSYYRRFVKNFADIARPLHQLTEKATTFVWTDACSEAFDTLREALITAPVLSYPSTRSNFILDTDASGVGVGAVLSQSDGGIERVVAYYSRALGKAERNYCITRKELLAVVESVKHFHHYIYGVTTVVRTDHGALTWLLNFKNIEGQMARWMETLGTYDLKIQHRPGRKHMNADSLSRLPCGGCEYCTKRDTHDRDKLVEDPKTGDVAVSSPEDACINQMDATADAQIRAITRSKSRDDSASECNWMNSKTLDDIAKAQKSDHRIVIVRSWLIAGQRPTWGEISHIGPEVKVYWAKWKQLLLKDDVVYRKRTSHTHLGNDINQLVLPHTYLEEVFKMLHEDPTCGHLGYTRTFKRFQDRFYWAGYKEDIRLFCLTCFRCQQAENQRRKPKAPLKQSRVGAVLERVALDIMGPLPVTSTGNKYILVIVDYFSRWTEAFAVDNMEAETITKVFVEQFICRFGVPRQIHTDQGRQFESNVFQQVCKYLDVDKTRTTPYHPQSNGMVERFNRTLRAMLTKLVSTDQRDWDVKLPLVMLAYRSSEHESTGMSPSMLMFGREVDLPVDLVFGTASEMEEDGDVNFARYAYALKTQIGRAHELAREKMAKASEKQKKGYDHRIAYNEFKRGDAVLTRSRPKLGISPKLQPAWDGPFLVIDQVTDLVYKIQKSARSLPKVIHHNSLKPYMGSVEKWL
ncbi:MAG: reverse transcriptase domain-containing protein [Sedimenticola sp.]